MWVATSSSWTITPRSITRSRIAEVTRGTKASSRISQIGRRRHRLYVERPVCGSRQAARGQSHHDRSRAAALRKSRGVQRHPRGSVRSDGEGIDCTLNGLYVGRDKQLVDNHTTIDHAQPHCGSHEVYKGILADQSDLTAKASTVR